MSDGNIPQEGCTLKENREGEESGGWERTQVKLNRGKTEGERGTVGEKEELTEIGEGEREREGRNRERREG